MSGELPNVVLAVAIGGLLGVELATESKTSRDDYRKCDHL